MPIWRHTGCFGGARSQSTNLIQNQGLSPELKSCYRCSTTQNNPYLQDILDTNNRRIGDRVNHRCRAPAVTVLGPYRCHVAGVGRECRSDLGAGLSGAPAMQQQILEGGLQRSGQWAQLMPAWTRRNTRRRKHWWVLATLYASARSRNLPIRSSCTTRNKAYPWEQLAALNAIVGGAGGLGGTQVTSSPVQQPSTAASGLGRCGGGRRHWFDLRCAGRRGRRCRRWSARPAR